MEHSTAIASPALPGGLSRRRVAVLLGAGAVAAASVFVVAPALADLPDTWARLASGDGRWLLAALVFEAVSFLGHIVLFRAVSRDAGARVGMRASTEITFAGHAATRLFAAGGAGGIALTAWALRRAGMERAQVAARMTTFLVLLYSVYMVALVVGGAGLWFGVLPGDAPVGVTLVPAAFGAAVIALALALPHLDGALGRFRRVGPAAAALGEGVRTSLHMVRRLDPGLAGALLWWVGDVAVLWASFEAFGDSPAIAVVVMAYFVGMLANTLPLPGGVGGVDGGMIGALIAFGVEPSLALVAVLAYRGFAFWLPIAPGVIAWVSLRRTVAGWERDSAMIVACPPSSPSAPATSAARSSSTSSRRAGTAPPSRAATTRSLPCASGAR